MADPRDPMEATGPYVPPTGVAPDVIHHYRQQQADTLTVEQIAKVFFVPPHLIDPSITPTWLEKMRAAAMIGDRARINALIEEEAGRIVTEGVPAPGAKSISPSSARTLAKQRAFDVVCGVLEELVEIDARSMRLD